MESHTTVIIAEDKKLFRDALVQSLAGHNVKTIAEAGNGEELLRCLADRKPDIVLLDLEMPVLDGHDTLLAILAKFPRMKVIILSNHYEKALLEYFEEIGARGYVPKDVLVGNIQSLLDAIRDVKQNRLHFYSKPGADLKFTFSQIRVISPMCAGKTNCEIAGELDINVRSVEKIRKKIYEKTGSRSAAEFFRFAFRHGLDFLKAGKLRKKKSQLLHHNPA